MHQLSLVPSSSPVQSLYSVTLRVLAALSITSKREVMATFIQKRHKAALASTEDMESESEKRKYSIQFISLFH